MYRTARSCTVPAFAAVFSAVTRSIVAVMVSTSLLSFAPRFPVASPVDAHGALAGRADRPQRPGTFDPLRSGPATLTTVGGRP
ncbi:hypothetical protein Misp05_33180 [Micromonospora sp. NBRC 107095]|nr:hypothetical protein Misp05_33180 [Micromonospora sp. NBRC 107095]